MVTTAPVYDGAPRWLWRLVLYAVTALIALSLVGVVLAMAGAYRTWLALPAAAIVTAAASPFVERLIRDIHHIDHTDHNTTRTGQWVAVAAVVIVLGAGLWSVGQSGRHVVTYHDPGVYASTAALLSADGALRTDVGEPADEPLVAAVLEQFDDARFGGPGAYVTGPTQLEYQFSHSPSVVMAAAYDVAGRRGLFASPIAAGMLALLATYLLFTRLARSAVVALAGMTALALCVPFLYVTRATYSEPFALAVISTGLALLAYHGRATVTWGFAIGLCIGASVLYRIDGQVALIALIGVGATAALGEADGRVLLAGAGGALVPAAIGLADLVWFSGEYWANHDSFGWLLPVAVVAGAAIVAAITTTRNRAWAQRVRDTWLPASAQIVGVVASVALALSWLVRPHVQTARADWEDRYVRRIEQLQEAVGLDLDGTRSYAELTVAAIGWYLGAATMVLAVVGCGVVVCRALRNVANPMARIVAFWFVTIPPFLLDWRITPYQPWATRRFIPIILPAILAFAVIAADLAVVYVRRRAAAPERTRAAWLPALAIGATHLVLVALIVVPVMFTTAPVRNMAEQRGFLGGLEQGCQVIDGRTTLTVGSDQFNVPLRAWCGVAAASLPGVEVDEIRWFAVEARARCEPAALLLPDPFHLPSLEAANTDAIFATPTVVDVVNPWFPEESIDRPPSEYWPERLGFVVAPVVLPDVCARA